MAFSKSNIQEPNLSTALQDKINIAQRDLLFQTVANETITIMQFAFVPFNIQSLYAVTSSGTCDITIKVNGVAVTGLHDVSCSTTETGATATAGNSVTLGQTLSITFSNNSSATDLAISMKVELV